MSLAAPRCVFCGAPLREGEVHWNDQHSKVQQALEADNERAREISFRPMPPSLPPEARAPSSTAVPADAFTLRSDAAFTSHGTAIPSVNAPMHDFLFPQYLGRLAYLGRLVVTLMATAMLSGLIFGILHEPMRFFAIVFIVIVARVYQIFGPARARARDAGQEGWFALLLFVPLVGFVVGLYLLFAPTRFDDLNG